MPRDQEFIRRYFILNLVLCFESLKVEGKNLGFVKVEKILKGSLDSIPLPSPSVKIQIMGGKFA